MATANFPDINGNPVTVELPLTPGRLAAASSRPVVLSNEDAAMVGPVTEAAPSTDTGSSGLNGRMQRLAQRVSSLIALLPTALTAGGNLKTAIQESIPAGTNNMGDVDIVTVPVDPFGVNADAASATGSISAKLRAIATALGTTALDLGSGTGGSRTLRFFRDTAQWIGGSGTNGSAVQRVTIATDDTLLAAMSAKLDTYLNDMSRGEFEAAAASASAQVIGTTGAIGDWIEGVLIVPETLSPGSVVLVDNATSYTIFVGGANSVLTLIPFYVPLRAKSVSGAWKLTLGTNVHAIATGNFT